MAHLKKYWIYYLAAVVAVIIIAYNWDTIRAWFSSEAEENTTARMGVNNIPELRLDVIPRSHLRQINYRERQIISNLFSITNRNGSSQTAIDNANVQLAGIGSGIRFVSNDGIASKAKCREGFDCWSLNLIIFTMCRCRSYALEQ